MALGGLREHRQQAFVGRLGVVEPAGVHRHRQALLLDLGVRGARPGAAAGAARAVNEASPRGGRGEITRRLVEVQRSLPYWPKTYSSRPASPIALPTSSRPPRSSAWRAGRPVITATARTCSARSTSTSAASGWMWALLRVLDDRREGAVEVEADDEVVGGPHQRGVLLLTRGRAELHGPHCSSPTRALSKRSVLA